MHPDEPPIDCDDSSPTPRYDTMNHPEEEDEIPSTSDSGPSVRRSASFYGPLWTTLVILFWYGLSNGIILLTKWLFTTHFPYPLTVTTYSNGVSFVWASVATLASRGRIPFPSRKIIRNYVAPIGIFTALEIGCSNVALKILTVSFGTILKGSAPVFTFAWGLLFGLEIFSWRVGGALLLIAIGIALASLGEGQEFQLAGFVLSLTATALGGLRWAITHRLLKGDGNNPSGNDRTIASNNNNNAAGDEGRGSNELEDDSGNDGNGHDTNEETSALNEEEFSDAKPLSPLAATLYTSPMTALCVLPFALALEGSEILGGGGDNDDGTNSTSHPNATAVNATLWSREEASASPPSDAWVVLGTMTAIATLVFVLLMSEYWLVKATSSLTLSVAGVFKELLTIGGGIFFFSETVDALNVVGFVACQIGILLYLYLRTTFRAAVAYAPVQEASTETPVESAEEASPAFRDGGETSGPDNGPRENPGLV